MAVLSVDPVAEGVVFGILTNDEEGDERGQRWVTSCKTSHLLDGRQQSPFDAVSEAELSLFWGSERDSGQGASCEGEVVVTSVEI